MRCARCGEEVAADEIYRFNGQDLCEDCAMSTQQVPKTCDVWAVNIARNTRKALGQTGVEGLTELQKNIYDLIVKEGKMTGMQICKKLGLTEADLKKEFAVLRHCELLRGSREGDQIFIIPW